MTIDNFFPSTCKLATQNSSSVQATEQSSESSVRLGLQQRPKTQSDVLSRRTASAPIRGRGWAYRAEPSRGWWQWPRAQGPLRTALTNWNLSKEGRLRREACLVRNSWDCECLPWSQGNAVKGTIVTLKSLMSCGWGEKRRTAPRTFCSYWAAITPVQSPGKRLYTDCFHWLGFYFSLKFWKYMYT